MVTFIQYGPDDFIQASLVARVERVEGNLCLVLWATGYAIDIETVAADWEGRVLDQLNALGGQSE